MGRIAGGVFMKCLMIKGGLWLVFGFGVVSAALASDVNHEALAGPDMIRTFKCVACHRVDDEQGRKRLGPDFNVIAARYAGSGGGATVEYLAGRIRQGARGSWGAVPMPSQTHVSDAQAQALAQWILSLMTVEPLAEK